VCYRSAARVIEEDVYPPQDPGMRCSFVIAWLAVGLLCGACGRQNNAKETHADEPSHWLTDFDAAQAEARSRSKMLLLNFTGSDWCPPCIMLHQQVFAQPEFIEYAARHLVLLEVDFPHNKPQTDEQKAANEKLAARFGVYWFPTEIVLDANGNKLG